VRVPVGWKKKKKKKRRLVRWGRREVGRKGERGHTFAFLVVEVESDARFFQADSMVDMSEDIGGVDSSVPVSRELCLDWIVWGGRERRALSGGEFHFRQRGYSRAAEIDAITFFS
jgi:hypothetical protein